MPWPANAWLSFSRSCHAQATNHTNNDVKETQGALGKLFILTVSIALSINEQSDNESILSWDESHLEICSNVSTPNTLLHATEQEVIVRACFFNFLLQYKNLYGIIILHPLLALKTLGCDELLGLFAKLSGFIIHFFFRDHRLHVLDHGRLMRGRQAASHTTIILQLTGDNGIRHGSKPCNGAL